MTDGLGMYAKPLRFGSPALAEELRRTSVTLNPFKPLRPMLVSSQILDVEYDRHGPLYVLEEL